MIHTSEWLMRYYSNYYDESLKSKIPEKWGEEHLFGHPICNASKSVSLLNLNHGNANGPNKMITCPDCIKILKSMGI